MLRVAGHTEGSDLAPTLALWMLVWLAAETRNGRQ
jgi:hypothetical protein